jgi:hypothetical protein
MVMLVRGLDWRAAVEGWTGLEGCVVVGQWLGRVRGEGAGGKGVLTVDSACNIRKASMLGTSDEVGERVLARYG